ncbi:peroxiredoxin-2E-2, chloroplastic-like [Canna indica]|uniref:Glutaredoxin-dependent peroxiredoxin n=1 Tax=Canna indica TaxID=4628 RepID=A0AAQ3QAJ8_9LILI|nr:peroxiredoxin-2E-2, chloroplastic-like [Canna indica]
MAASLATAKLVAPLSLSSNVVRLAPAAVRLPRLLAAGASPLRFCRRRSAASYPRFFASSVSAPAASASIAVGDKLPDATLSFFDSDGELKTVTVSELTKGKKAIFFAVPGAFTPTCSQKHLPGFVEKAGELRAKGVDTIACVSVNDAFVMQAWKKDLKIGDEVMLLSDGNGEFTKALGVELDLRDKPVGLGVRSRRYALLAEDGVVKVLNLEEGGAFTFSSAEDMLKVL